MSTNNFTELRTAERESIAAIYGPAGFEVSGDRPNQHSHLVRKRLCAQELGPLAVEPQPEQPTPTWTDIIEQVSVWTDNYIGQRKFPKYAATCGEFEYQTRRDVQRIAREGVATSGAFIETIGRVLMNRSFANPNDEIAAYALRSQDVILRWAGVHRLVDAPLAYALATTPKPHPDRTFSSSLRFNPKWFREANKYRRVVFDGNKFADMRDETDSKHPMRYDRPAETLFGCAGRHWIPRIYKGLVHLGQQNGLFAESYFAERKEHGYEDAL